MAPFDRSQYGVPIGVPQ